MLTILFMLDWLLSLVQVYIIYTRVLGYKIKKIKLMFLIAPITTFVLIHIVIIRDMEYFTTLTIIMISLIITLLIIFEESVRKLLITFLPIMFFISITNMVVKIIYKTFKDIDENSIIEKELTSIICMLIAVLLILLILFVLKNKRIETNLKNITFNKTLYLILLCFGSLLTFIIILTNLISLDIDNQKIVSIKLLIIILVIVYMLVNIFLINLFISKERYRVVSEMNRNYNELQKDYYEHLLEQEKDTRRFRHDIKNHILCIRELIGENMMSESLSYINKLYNDIRDITKVYDAGNDIINAIINYYDRKCNENNIKVNVDGKIICTLNIDSSDLCIIVSNLISNAYEENLRIKELNDRKINIDIKNGDKFFMFRITNPICFTDKNFTEENFKTKKVDIKNHGFGIQNVKRIVEKYNGEIEFIENDDITVKVIIKYI